MLQITDKDFEKIVATAIDELPKQYTDNMKNVFIVVEADPTEEQRTRLHLVNGVTLFGLYEGVPLTDRRGGYSVTIPDKITIFKNPIAASCQTLAQLKEQVKRTVWHEIAHHYGLDHDRITELERKSSQ